MQTRSRWFGALGTIALVVILGAVALAQRNGFGGFGGGPSSAEPNIPYDGRFTFARIRYQTAPGGFWAGGRPSWIHGYPLSERNLMKIRRHRRNVPERKLVWSHLGNCLGKSGRFLHRRLSPRELP